MSRKIQTALIIIALALVLILGGMLFAVKWFYDNHVFVEGEAYPKNAEFLNLRGTGISVAHYDALHAQLPDCDIYWELPFQGKYYAEDTKSLRITTISDRDMELLSYLTELESIDATACREYDQLVKLGEMYPDLQVSYQVTIDGRVYGQDAKEVTLTSLTEEDAALMEYLPELTAVHAEGCTDYAQLVALQTRHPEYTVTYTVTIFGETYPETTTQLSYQKLDNVEELMAQLGNLPALESVHLEEPSASAESLVQLKEAYPFVTWSKTIFGQKHSSEDTEFDFSDMDFDSTDEVENAMKFFPNAEKVIMCDCGFDNETMAEFRERMRAEYKVVWSVIVTGVTVRTDQTIFHSSGEQVSLIDEQSYDLYYCEDMVIVDIGHSQVKYVEWLRGMPNLKYLILADNWIKDITPLSSCKNLIYLELMMNHHFTDLTPLLECTALEDLNLADTYVDPEPLAQMTWLKNLWINQTPVTSAERQLLTESLPDTRIEFDHGHYTGGGWRELQNYYDMRDLMGLPYNTW